MLKVVSQLTHSTHSLIELGTRELRSLAKSDYAGDVFGSRSSIAFMMPTIKEFRQS
jgi:hypothetical protein